MRLWHKDLIPYLPKKQLMAQWRELCAIASNLASKGTPNHILVNKILKYSKNHFWNYHSLIIKEMHNRGYRTTSKSMDLFSDWNNERYLKQCLYNLQEKYDCGGISEEEWKLIQENFNV